MRPNLNLMKATLTGALGGLLFGFDTVVISGIIDAVVKLYGLDPWGKGWTVAIALIGTVVGSFAAGSVGQKLGGRETLRLTAVLYVVSAIGSALAWNWPSLMFFRFLGGLGIGVDHHHRVDLSLGRTPQQQRERRRFGLHHHRLRDCVAAVGGDRDLDLGRARLGPRRIG